MSAVEDGAASPFAIRKASCPPCVNFCQKAHFVKSELCCLQQQQEIAAMPARSLKGRNVKSEPRQGWWAV